VDLSLSNILSCRLVPFKCLRWGPAKWPRTYDQPIVCLASQTHPVQSPLKIAPSTLASPQCSCGYHSSAIVYLLSVLSVTIQPWSWYWPHPYAMLGGEQHCVYTVAMRYSSGPVSCGTCPSDWPCMRSVVGEHGAWAGCIIMLLTSQPIWFMLLTAQIPAWKKTSTALSVSQERGRSKPFFS
jgi:hypothetical protein